MASRIELKKLEFLRSVLGAELCNFYDVKAFRAKGLPNGAGPSNMPWLRRILPQWIPGIARWKVRSAFDVHDWFYYWGGYTPLDRLRADRAMRKVLRFAGHGAPRCARRLLFSMKVSYYAAVQVKGSGSYNWR